MSTWERSRRKSISNRELLIAISHNEFEEVDRLINEGADINFKDPDGYSALLLAVEFSDFKVVQLLLDKGANIDIKSNNNESLLDIAKRLKKSNIIRVLEVNINKKLQPPELDVVKIYTTPKDEPVQVQKLIHNEKYNSIYDNIYRLKALMLFLYRGIACKYFFRLDFEENGIQKFDHIVFAYNEGNKKVYRLILAKHEIDETEKITADKLFSHVDYNLIKYFRSYQACKKGSFKDGLIENFTICTNIDFDFDSLKKANINIRKIEEQDNVADVKSRIKNQSRYKFTDSFISRLTEELKNCKLKKNNVGNNDVKGFLEHLIFAVNQPNEEEFGNIVKKEIGREFDFITTENTYSIFCIKMLDWTKSKKTFIPHSDGEELFDDLKKNSFIWYNVEDPVKLFIGRQENLNNMHKLLQESENQIICISGLSGIGKSELVRKYIVEFANYYDNKIIWINADNYHTLVNSFHKLANDKLGINIINVDGKEKDLNLLIAEVYQNFSKSKSLFVFDNSEMYKSLSDFDAGIDRFLPNLPENSHKPHVIVTSRNQDWPDTVKLQILEAFNETETVKYISQSFNTIDEKKAIALGKKLYFLPLALKLTIAHILAQNNNSIFEISNYIDKLSDISTSNDCFIQVVQTIWNLIIDSLKQEKNEALKIMNLISYFLPNNIPLKTLLNFTNDHEKLTSAIKLLEKYSLVSIHHKTLNIHRLIQQVIRTKLIDNNEEKKTLERILKSIESIHINSQNVDHFITIWSYSKNHIDLIETYHNVFSLITGELTSCGRIDEAHSMGIEIVELLNPLSSDNSNVQSGLMNMKSRLGDILLRQGKYEAALREFEELYEQEIGLKGSTDNKTLNTKSDIALALQKLGKTDEALRCYQEILEIRRVTLGESHSATLSIKSHMATVLMEQEKYDEALPIFEQVYKAQKSRLGDNHYDTLMTRNSMAALFLFQRKHEEALKIFQDIYNARNDMLFENHPALLVARQNIATTLQRQKKYDLALEIYEEVYKIQRELLGEHHPEVLAIRGEIALMLHMLGKPDEALTIFREVLEKQSEVLGLYHPLVLRTQFFIAHNLEEQCRYSEALPIYQELLKVGISATGVASMHLKLHNSIGSIFMLQGNVDKALKHYTEVLKITENTYGTNNPKTLIAQSNVGSLYYKKKDYNKALSILSEMHETEEIVFGKDHETYNSTYHFMKKILFEKELHETQLRNNAEVPTDDPLVAIENGDLTLLKRLIKKGASINTRDTSKKTLLHHATRVNRLEIVRFLLKKGADMTVITEKGKTSLHVAVLQNHLEIADELLKNVNYEQLRGFVDAKTTMTGSTALHVAAKNGFYDVAKVLLMRGAIYEVKNNDGKQPIELAKNTMVITLLNEIGELFELARFGCKECYDRLKLSSEYLTVSNARDCQGYNLIQVAIVNNHRKLVKLLGELSIEKSRDTSCLPIFNINLDEILSLANCALMRLRDDRCAMKTVLKHLRKLVVSFRMQDKRVLDRNLLMIEEILAILKSRKEDESLMDIARIALERHTKLLEMSMYSVKLLEASKRNDWNLVEKCIVELANVNVTDEGGWTPLLHAANAGNEKVVKLLLNNNARVNCATVTGKNTSLHVAVNKGHLGIVKLLLERDATSEFLNAKTEAKGSTAVHIAAKIGCLDTILLLLRNSAIYCLPNKDGELAIDLTSDDNVRMFFEMIDELFYDVKNGRVEIVKKLRGLERDLFLAVISASNEEEFNLANVAVARGYLELANEILGLSRE